MLAVRRSGRVLVVLASLCATSAHASDLDALELADKASGQVEQMRSWRLFVEAAVSQTANRLTRQHDNLGRVALDFRLDTRLSDAWRLVLSDRLDLVNADTGGAAESVNTLREAYVSWSPAADWGMDLGRVNLRHGAAMGYNPTDWFKVNAVRAAFSADPMALRENRQGTVVLQAQKLWDRGSFSVAASPKLADTPSSRALSANAGATNHASRWLMTGSLKVSEGFSPQLLLHGGSHMGSQWGVNLSGLLGSSTVVFAEWAGGRDRTLVDHALSRATPLRQRQRGAIGLTHTLPINLSVTLEAEHNDAGMNRADWDALAAVPGAQLQVLDAAQDRLDLPSRQAWFLHFRWPDAGMPRLDLSGYLRRESATQSSTAWLEARRRWDQLDLTLQWQAFFGPRGSVFATVPSRRSVELALRYYLP